MTDRTVNVTDEQIQGANAVLRRGMEIGHQHGFEKGYKSARGNMWLVLLLALAVDVVFVFLLHAYLTGVIR